MNRVMIIGIAGGSCSGKTRLLGQIASHLGQQQCSVVLQDDYYFSKPAARADNLKFNFDHPDALDFDLLSRDLTALKEGRPIRSPHYDFAKHVRIEGRFKTIEPRPIVLVDGILILNSQRVRAALDFSAFIRCDAATRLQRRIARDVEERGRERGNVIAQFEAQVEPMHAAYVKPSSIYASQVYDQSAMEDGSALSGMLSYCKSHEAVA